MQKHSFHALARPGSGDTPFTAARRNSRAKHEPKQAARYRLFYFMDANGEAHTGRHVAFLHFHGLVTLVPAVPHPI